MKGKNRYNSSPYSRVLLCLRFVLFLDSFFSKKVTLNYNSSYLYITLGWSKHWVQELYHREWHS